MSAFAHPNHSSRFVIQYVRHILMPFANRDLVNGDSQAFALRSAMRLLQKVFIDRFDGLGIQIEMARHVLDRHRFAQLVDVACQPMRDSLTGIGKVELLHPGMSAGRTPHPAIFDPEECLSGTDVQIADEPSAVMRVNLPRSVACVQMENTELY